MKRLLFSALMGVLALFIVLVTSSFTGVLVPISASSIVVSAVMGIAGVITLIIVDMVFF